MPTDPTQEAIDLINANREHLREIEARWEKEDRMSEPELLRYRAVQSMDLAIDAIRSAAKIWSELDEDLLAAPCEEAAVSIEQMKPPAQDTEETP